jgi:hypothetical protein
LILLKINRRKRFVYLSYIKQEFLEHLHLFFLCFCLLELIQTNSSANALHITENQLVTSTILALLLNFASLKIYKNKSQTQFYALSIPICTIPQPELSGALFVRRSQTKEGTEGG